MNYIIRYLDENGKAIYIPTDYEYVITEWEFMHRHPNLFKEPRLFIEINLEEFQDKCKKEARKRLEETFGRSKK